MWPDSLQKLFKYQIKFNLEMKEKTKKIIFYGTLVILFSIIRPILQIFPENKVLIYSIYVIIIILLSIIFRKSNIFYIKSLEERKEILTSEKTFRIAKIVSYTLSSMMVFAGIISYLLYKRMDMLTTLCGFGLFFIIVIFLADKFGHKKD